MNCASWQLHMNRVLCDGQGGGFHDVYRRAASPPNSRESALLLLHLIGSKENDREKSLTRVRLSEVTLLRLWDRYRLPVEFLNEVQDWLLIAGWTLFFAGKTYGAVRVDAVDNWPRLSSSRIAEDLSAVRTGTFDFAQLEGLWSDRRKSAPEPESGH